MQKNEPSLTGSRDISFQSQEFEDGSCHFEGFEPHFHTNMTSQTQSCKTMKKCKCDISGVCLKSCRLLKFPKGISLGFKFCCYGNQNEHNCLSLRKQKVYYLSNSVVQKII